MKNGMSTPKSKVDKHTGRDKRCQTNYYFVFF